MGFERLFLDKADDVVVPLDSDILPCQARGQAFLC